MGLPEIVVHATGSEQAAEGERDPRSDAQSLGFGVGDFDGAPAAAVDVQDRLNHRRGRRIGEVVDGVGDDGGSQRRHGCRVHLVSGPAATAHPHRRQVNESTVAAACSGETELPFLGPCGGRRRGAVRLGAAGRLEFDQAVPRQVGQMRHHDALGALNTHGRGLASLGQLVVVRSSTASQPSNAETTRMSRRVRRRRAPRPARSQHRRYRRTGLRGAGGLQCLHQSADPFGDRTVGARDDDVIDVCEASFIEDRVD